MRKNVFTESIFEFAFCLLLVACIPDLLEIQFPRSLHLQLSFCYRLWTLLSSRALLVRDLAAMDHAVKASRSHPWNKLRFENDELEELYQRYTHKIQWISVFGVVTLVVMLTGIMAILSLAYNQAATIHVSWLLFTHATSEMISRLSAFFRPKLECLQWLPLSPVHHHFNLVEVSCDSWSSFAIFVLCNLVLLVGFLHHLDAKLEWLRFAGRYARSDGWRRLANRFVQKLPGTSLDFWWQSSALKHGDEVIEL